MPDELTPGTPGQGGASEAPGAAGQGFDFERAYGEIRPEFTRATQELAHTTERLSAFEQLFEQLHDTDPEVQQQAMDALGFELDTGQSAPETAEEWSDPLEEEVATLRAWRDEQVARQELEASYEADAEIKELRDDYIGAEIDTIESFTEQTFDEQDEEILGNLAIAMSGDDGIPDVRGAYQRLYGSEGFLERQRSGWIGTKTGHAQAPAGTTIPADQKPKTRADRVAYMDQRVADLDQQ